MDGHHQDDCKHLQPISVHNYFQKYPIKLQIILHFTSTQLLPYQDLVKARFLLCRLSFPTSAAPCWWTSTRWRHTFTPTRRWATQNHCKRRFQNRGCRHTFIIMRRWATPNRFKNRYQSLGWRHTRTRRRWATLNHCRKRFPSCGCRRTRTRCFPSTRCWRWTRIIRRRRRRRPRSRVLHPSSQSPQKVFRSILLLL